MSVRKIKEAGCDGFFSTRGFFKKRNSSIFLPNTRKSLNWPGTINMHNGGQILGQTFRYVVSCTQQHLIWHCDSASTSNGYIYLSGYFITRSPTIPHKKMLNLLSSSTKDHYGLSLWQRIVFKNGWSKTLIYLYRF